MAVRQHLGGQWKLLWSPELLLSVWT